MALVSAFAPVGAANGAFGNSIAVTIAASNVATALPFTTNYGTSLRIANTSTGIIAVTTGNSAANAVAVIPTSGSPANGLVIQPGDTAIFQIPPNATFIGIIGASANGTAYITMGEGAGI
jgi:hypothetical protein